MILNIKVSEAMDEVINDLCLDVEFSFKKVFEYIDRNEAIEKRV